MNHLPASVLNKQGFTDAPEWRRRILDSMRARVDDNLQNSLAIPDQAGGWMHQYVCPDHGLPLIFNFTSPALHQCPKGDTHQGGIYDAAFRVFAHLHFSALARDAAVLYQGTSNRDYFRASYEILSRYAAHYGQFDGGKESQPWMLAGKAFQQALTEAIWAMYLLIAYEILLPQLSRSQADQIKDRLLRPIAGTLTAAHHSFVFQQGHLESNYTAWLIAALGSLGLALDDKGLVEQALYGPGGFTAHLDAAILPDGFEYEGTPYYHNFVVRAYSLLAEIARPHGIDLYALRGKKGQSIQGMWSAFASLAWPDGSVPFLNDGSYWQESSFDAEVCEVYEIAFARTGDQRYAWLLDRAYQRRGVDRDVWTALRFANQEISNDLQFAMKPVCLRDIGFAVLRDPTQPNGFSALLRFSPHGGSHTHLDSLALLLFPCCLDAGSPPYGCEARKTWYQQTAAHNTVLVDGLSQSSMGGRLLAWTVQSSSSKVRAVNDEVYPSVKYTRQVALEANRVSDHAKLSSETEHTFDWLLHTDVPLEFSGVQLSPARGSLFSEGRVPSFTW